MPGLATIFTGGSNPAIGAAEKARNDEAFRQTQIREGTAAVDRTFAGSFNDDFFTGRKNAFLNYATPQLEQQYGDTRKALTFSLDRSGTLDSSTRAQKFGELQQLYDTNKQSIADQALSYENEARGSVENARSGLISSLNASGDATGLANQAISKAQALSAPQAFSPLSQLFSSFTSGLGQQAAQERAEAASGGTYEARFNTGLFGPKKSAVQVRA